MVSHHQLYEKYGDLIREVYQDIREKEIHALKFLDEAARKITENPRDGIQMGHMGLAVAVVRLHEEGFFKRK